MVAPLMMIDNQCLLMGLQPPDLIIDKGLANDVDYWLAATLCADDVVVMLGWLISIRSPSFAMEYPPG